MCGISGLISIDKISEYETSNMNKINQELEMRGPDHVGAWMNLSGTVRLNHTRLSIVDNSSAGSQPMRFDHLCITFNGEIYNYSDIRSKLKNSGYKFETRTDTEVMLKAYHLYGTACLVKFDGQFSFAIWDEKKKELFIARDRFGKKPFYYTISDNKFKFSSYLPSLIKNDNQKLSINKTAIDFYFRLGIIPAPHTPFLRYQKLENGVAGIIKLENNKLKMNTWKYYELEFETEGSEVSENKAIKETKNAIVEGVEKRLNTDVNSCVFLSGGLDSSLITAIAYKELNVKIPTIAIGFEETFGKSGDEFEYSDYVSDLFGTHHTKNRISNELVLKNIEDCYLRINEPMWGFDMMGHYLMAKSIKNKYKVALSGMGADEMWMGYSWHREMTKYDMSAEKLFSIFIQNDESLSKYCSDEVLANSDTNDLVKKYFEALNGHKCDEFEKILHSELNLFLPEDALKRSDSTTMRHGLEVRVPFLDSEVINIGRKIHHSLKCKHGIDKYIIKKISESYFSDSFIHREKGYFPVAPLQYQSKEIFEFMKEILMDEKSNYYKLYNKTYILELLSRKTITTREKYILWKITCLECWIRQFSGNN
ncbi:MAG: asparagine synthase (glutamine-hydrolyzing) [Tissierellales bacterium]|jgi:asparagine synthase (glutamine-hydrolysing)|nr:asparagine synthase (glutamine-hydrolyzing) [Tissierellales bacterium]